MSSEDSVHMKAGDLIRVQLAPKENEAFMPLNPPKIYLVMMFYNFGINSAQSEVTFIDGDFEFHNSDIMEYAIVAPIDNVKSFKSIQISEAIGVHCLCCIGKSVFTCTHTRGLFGATWTELPTFNSNLINETRISVTKIRRALPK